MRHLVYGGLIAIVTASPGDALHAQAASDPRLDRASASAAQALVDSARAERLPDKAITGVLQEGLSQHASGPRIVRAMQDYLHALRGAAVALGPGSSEAELVAGAGALLAAVPPHALQQIRAARGREPIVVPLVVLGDLVARGVPAAAAGTAIADATKSGLADAELNLFRERVEKDIASGVAAGAALESVARRLPSATVPPPADSTRRLRKPLANFDNFARLRIEQASGNAGSAVEDFRVDGTVSLGDGSRLALLGDARTTMTAFMNPMTYVKAGLLATAGNVRAGIAAGPDVRAFTMAGSSWIAPAIRANAWRVAGPWTYSLSASYGRVPTLTAANAVSPFPAATRIAGAPRFDANSSDTAILAPPTGKPPTLTDSSGLVGTARESLAAIQAMATDAQFGISRRFGRVELDALGGIRSYSSGRANAWSSATVDVAVGDRLAISAGGVVGPENIVAPVNGPRLFAGVRMTTGDRFAPPPPVPVSENRTKVFSFSAIQENATTTFEIRAPGARAVEIVGDFSEWIPLRMAYADDDRWVIARPVEPGMHRVRVRIDGGTWIAPPGLPRSRDVFGGEVGVLTITGM